MARGNKGVADVEEGGAEDEDGAEEGGAEDDGAKDDGASDETAEMVEDAENAEDAGVVDDLPLQKSLLLFFFLAGVTVTVAETVFTTVVVY